LSCLRPLVDGGVRFEFIAYLVPSHQLVGLPSFW
jgi:hypothetical protein